MRHFSLGLLALLGLFCISAALSENESKDNVKQLVQDAIEKATKQYEDMVLNATINGAQTRRPPREAVKSTKKTQEIGRISSIYRKAYKSLTSENKLSSELALKHLQEVLPLQCEFPTLECDENAKYRSVDGSCNNIEHIYWGAAGIPMARLLPPAYKENTDDEPRGGLDGGTLPPVRQVSLNVHIGDGDSYEQNVTHMVAQFGQFLDHDITRTPVNSLVCCNNPAPAEECWTIAVAEDDPHYKDHSVTCLDFVRSTEHCFPSSGINHREQFNDITAYVDGSVVYGSDSETFEILRGEHKEGKLAENSEHSGFLPWRSDVIADDDRKQVIAGDVRANEMPGLTVLHSLFLREHNRIANELGQLRADWDDEKIFQETRRIIAAELQQITYGEYLPAMLGIEAMKTYDLNLPENHTSFTTYDSSLDATIFNNFATAAYRFGHTLVNGLIQLYVDHNIVGEYNVRDNYLVSDQIIGNDHQSVSGYDLILNGLVRQKSQAYDGEIHGDMTNYLFHTATFVGSDLAARNIQRGRDHGIPSYNEFRKYCNIPELPPTWAAAGRPADISVEAWDKLENAGYASPRDVDLYTGGLSEVAESAALSGPTFICLQGIQFQRLMKGDRFFFTHGDVSGGFTAEQLKALRARTLGDIICQNSALKEAAVNVFYIESQVNPMKSCGSTTRILDTSLFAELEETTTTSPTTTSTTEAGTATIAATAFATLFATLLCSFAVGSRAIILRIF